MKEIGTLFSLIGNHLEYDKKIYLLKEPVEFGGKLLEKHSCTKELRKLFGLYENFWQNRIVFGEIITQSSIDKSYQYGHSIRRNNNIISESWGIFMPLPSSLLKNLL